MIAAANNTVRRRVTGQPEFGRRLNQACDQHPHCPPLHHGRLQWIRSEMQKRGQPISIESVHKWLRGDNKAGQRYCEVLAEVLGVDPGWLMLGYAPEMQPKERRARNAMADGSVNLVAGFIQMDGGHPSFPEEGDKRAEDGQIDLYAIIRGAYYSIHIALGTVDGRKAHFSVPSTHENVMVLGVIRDGFSIDVFELTPELIADHGTSRGKSIDVVVDGSKLRRIESFEKRF